MLSRKSLVTSMVLVAGYITVCKVDDALVREYQDLQKITWLIAEDVKIERTNFKDLLFNTTRRKESWEKYRYQYLDETDFLMLIRTNPNLAIVPYGKKVLAKYGLQKSDFTSADPSIARINIDRAILTTTSNTIDSLRAPSENTKQRLVRLKAKQETYAVGHNHDIEFQLLSSFDGPENQYYYDIGQGPQLTGPTPLVFPQKPQSLSLTMIHKNPVTGEQGKHRINVIP